MKKWLVLICLFLLGCQSAEPANKLGVHLLLDDGRQQWPVAVWDEHLRVASEAVGEGGFVVEVITLDDLDVVKWQTFMDLCAKHQLTPVIRLATTYDTENDFWVAPERDENGRYSPTAQTYATFLSALNWPTNPLIIIGNEPNHGNEWSGKPEPADYARFFIDTATAIKQSLPNAKILNAGLDPYTPHTGSLPFVDGQLYMDAESFMDGMIAAEPNVFNYVDIWASHPYPLGPFSAPPWEQAYQIDWINDASNPHRWQSPAGLNNRGVNGYEWELGKLATYGIEPLPIFISETGWRHGEGWPSTQTVADYVTLSLVGNDGKFPNYPSTGWTPWLDDPRIIGVAFFALDGHPSEWAHTNWVTLNEQGNIIDRLPPFDALRNVRNQLP